MGAVRWARATSSLPFCPLSLLCPTPHHVPSISQGPTRSAHAADSGEWGPVRGPVQTVHSCTVSEGNGVSVG